MTAAIGALTVAAVAAGLVPAAGGASRASAVAPEQELVVLLAAHAVVAKPGTPAQVGIVRARRPITARQTVLPVVGKRITRDGVHWLRVRVPGRPNGMTGWIRQRATVPVTTSWHLVIRTAVRRVLVYRRGRLARTFAAVVGKPSTPTPHGQFFVEESVRMPLGSAGAPFALALSARSNVLQEFEGGPGQIAIHGIMNLGGTPGTAVSHGCVRLGDADIRWLAEHIAPGVPVTIAD
jgi:lipoprotein-anchoring transpeptidase ErfK/SrfK